MAVRTREIDMPTTPPLPLGQRIAHDITEQIRTGQIRPGDRLPSARKLMDQYQCSITPVREAISALKIMGLVVGQPGVAVYVAQRPAAE